MSTMHKHHVKVLESLTVKPYAERQTQKQALKHKCNHYKYSSIKSYAARIISSKEWYLEFSGGFCQNCALYITSNMMEMTTKNETIMPDSIDAARIPTMGATSESCLLFSLSYHSIAKFIFQNTNLWIRTFNHVETCINLLACLAEEYIEKTGTISHTELSTAYNEFAELLIGVVDNVSLLQTHHWQCIFERRKLFVYFFGWLRYIKDQMKYGLYWKFKWGPATMHCCVFLITIAVHQMKNNNDLKLQLHFDWEKMKFWINGLAEEFRHDVGINYNNKYIIWSMVSLKSNVFSHETYKLFRLFSKTRFKMQWNDMECHNIKCSVKRKHYGILYKCKRCMVVRYCSKHCQKIDWNKNYHKLCCAKLVNIKTQWK